MLFAYATGSVAVPGCPAERTPRQGCSLGQALAQASAGTTVALATRGRVAHYLGNWTVSTAGTSAVAPLVIAPAPGVGSSTLDGNGGDQLNSEKYRQARSLFSGAATAFDGAPYCTRCEWDQTTVNIGGPEIRRYFRAADAAFFDRRSLRLLSEW